LDLFERYCLPSVAGQLDKNFTWLLCLDERTPRPIRRRLAGLGAGCAQAKTLYLAPGSRMQPAVVAAIMDRGDPPSFLMTSRLDNDDAIHLRYVQRLHELFDRQALQFVNFSNGYTYRLMDRSLRRYRHPSNPFVTLIERYSTQPRTVLCAQHSEIGNVGPVFQVQDSPRWLQVIHDQNVRNTARGTLVPADHVLLLRREFAIRE
jgi:hypothetical protein